MSADDGITRYVQEARMLRLPLVSLLLLAFLTPAWSQKYGDIVNGDYVRRHFELKEGEVVKFEEFKKKTYPTATVVWGAPEKRDQMRIKAGVAPSGSKLMVVFADLRHESEFGRVLNTYKDGVEVNGLGRRAVFSQKWKQLSVLVSSALAIHVHLDHAGGKDLKSDLIAIARDLAKKLK
jgi:hypothetical protein